MSKLGEGEGMAAENKWGTTVHCQTHLNKLTNMNYKLSKFNSITLTARFVGRADTEDFLS